MNEIDFTDANGTASRYKINVPADAGEKIYGLHIHFHGDGGGGYRDFPNVETRYDLIGVTVQAPDPNLRWGRNQGVVHGFYANDLVQNELIKKYNINLDRIFFSGVSGGAYFLSGSFIPTYGSQYASGAYLMCGGETPRVPFANQQFLANFRIHWQVTAGERQDILASVNNSINSYTQALANVQNAQPNIQTSEIVGAGGHCEFDGVAYTSGIQMMVDEGFKTILQLQ